MYSDWLEAFSPAMFHIGQDEVLDIVTQRFATIVIIDTASKMKIERVYRRFTLAVGTQPRALWTGWNRRARAARCQPEQIARPLKIENRAECSSGGGLHVLVERLPEQVN